MGALTDGTCSSLLCEQCYVPDSSQSMPPHKLDQGQKSKTEKEELRLDKK